MRKEEGLGYGNDVGEIQYLVFREVDGRLEGVCVGVFKFRNFWVQFWVNLVWSFRMYRRMGVWCFVYRCLSFKCDYQGIQRRDVEEVDFYSYILFVVFWLILDMIFVFVFTLFFEYVLSFLYMFFIRMIFVGEIIFFIFFGFLKFQLGNVNLYCLCINRFG